MILSILVLFFLVLIIFCFRYFQIWIIITCLLFIHSLMKCKRRNHHCEYDDRHQDDNNSFFFSRKKQKKIFIFFSIYRLWSVCWCAHICLYYKWFFFFWLAWLLRYSSIVGWLIGNMILEIDPKKKISKHWIDWLIIGIIIYSNKKFLSFLFCFTRISSHHTHIIMTKTTNM